MINFFIYDVQYLLFNRLLRYLFGCLQRTVLEKWPEHETLKTRVVRLVNCAKSKSDKLKLRKCIVLFHLQCVFIFTLFLPGHHESKNM